MMNKQSVLTALAEAGERSDELHRASRRVLVDAVREAAREGLSQREIARAVGRSQPEIARLLRFIPVTERGRELARHRRSVLEVLDAAGLRDVKVFGSVARGEDRESSDVDLLVTADEPPSLFELGRVEQALSSMLNSPVELTLESALRDTIRERAMREALPL